MKTLHDGYKAHVWAFLVLCFIIRITSGKKHKKTISNIHDPNSIIRLQIIQEIFQPW